LDRKCILRHFVDVPLLVYARIIPQVYALLRVMAQIDSSSGCRRDSLQSVHVASYLGDGPLLVDSRVGPQVHTVMRVVTQVDPGASSVGRPTHDAAKQLIGVHDIRCYIPFLRLSNNFGTNSICPERPPRRMGGHPVVTG